MADAGAKTNTAALRPGCRSIPAARFRHSAELNGAIKQQKKFCAGEILVGWSKGNRDDVDV
jgi:hypothetical protein